MKIKLKSSAFTRKEKGFWLLSVLVILISYGIYRQDSLLNVIASVTGVSSLLYIAKGNPIGQIFVVIFSLLYGVIAYMNAYYGEMLTYVGMTMPMAVLSFYSWITHPFQENASQVQVNTLNRKEIACLFVLTAIVTFVFYFILKAFSTANLIWSTISVMTSFAAVYLTYKRSAYYAVAYAMNDFVLIILWSFAFFRQPSYLSVVMCFIIFFLYDIYGFINWSRMQQKQQQITNATNNSKEN